ncbi:MAG: hypothetical protein ACK4L7_07680 [Flavobacteriales bacterium]
MLLPPEMMRASLMALALPCTLCAGAQVLIDKPLELTGGLDQQRQVLGLRPAASPDDALDASAFQSGAAHWAGEAPVADPWPLTLASLSGAPTPGTSIVVRIASPQAGPAHLTLNGHGPYAVLSGPGDTLSTGALSPGTVLALVFDGTAFHVANGADHAVRPCPSGLVAVNRQYCIAPEESGPIGFFDAAVACAQAGLRMCTWGEFFHACQRRVELGLNGMTNNWEWTNDASNEDLSVRVAGNGSCGSNGNTLASSGASTYARCCYTR